MALFTKMPRRVLLGNWLPSIRVLGNLALSSVAIDRPARTAPHRTFYTEGQGLPILTVRGNPVSGTRVAVRGERRTVQWERAASKPFRFPLTSVAPINQLRMIASTDPHFLPLAPVRHPCIGPASFIEVQKEDTPCVHRA